ncbi:hypothetical protein KAR48_20715 [bacterium]|nr:hypothetical protein [bacterium]
MNSTTERWTPWALLFGSAFMFYLGGGDRPLEMAVWLAPFLLLRFFMIQRSGKAFLLAYPVITVSIFLASKGMTPMPILFFAISMAISGVYILLPYLLTRILLRRIPAVLTTLLFPLLMTTFDYLATMSGWGTWGHSVYGLNNLALLQLTSVTGLWGVGFLIAWTAAVGNNVWERSVNRINNKLLLTWGAVLVTTLLFGVIRLGIGARTHDITAAGVILSNEQQMAFNDAVLPLAADSCITSEEINVIRTLSFQMADSLLQNTVEMAVEGVDLVMWNEAALPVFRQDADSIMQLVQTLALNRNIYIGATFAVVEDDLSNGLEKAIENQLILISPKGEQLWQYAKSVLVPGPETMMSIPGDSTLKLASTKHGDFSGAICYEMDFPGYISQAGGIKSELLLAPANDWLEIKRTHARMARVRAIENGTALFRVASRGVSHSVDPLGRVIDKWDFFESGGQFVMTVKVGSVFTLYSVLGDALAKFSVLGALLMVAWGIVNAVKSRKTIHK